MKTWKYIMTAVLWGLMGFLACRAVAVPTWSNPVGGSNFNYVGDEVRWGVPVDQEQSGLRWTELPILTGVFPLGILEHYNYVVKIGTAPTAIDLTTHGMIVTLGIDETLNAPGPPLSDDRITLPPVILNTGSLSILGWGRAPDSLSDAFQSPENSTNWTYLWAHKPIPAPSALICCVVGLFALTRKRFVW